MYHPQIGGGSALVWKLYLPMRCGSFTVTEPCTSKDVSSISGRLHRFGMEDIFVKGVRIVYNSEGHKSWLYLAEWIYLPMER